ncbi:MAG: hypothetical protein S0880_15370 [Actinomycetota bacterium]|nr:hypothetical protein [Actinomycetota bacterium]
MADRAEQYELVRTAVAGAVVARDVISVRGPEAVTYLHGQLSQQVEGLAVGATASTLLLQPAGKLDARLRMTRLADDEVVLDIEGGFGEAVVARLERFKLRTKCDIERLDDWTTVSLRGPGAAAVAADNAGDARIVADASWPGAPGVDLLGPGVGLPAGVTGCDTDVLELVRVEAGWPAMGSELTEKTIPAEAGIVDAAVDFTKGCYVGQELVARIDSRGGNVPRHLRGVRVTGGVPEAGAELSVDGASVGSLTTVAVRPDGVAVALAYVKRAIEPPADAIVEGPDGPLAAEIALLPLVG